MADVADVNGPEIPTRRDTDGRYGDTGLKLPTPRIPQHVPSTSKSYCISQGVSGIYLNTVKLKELNDGPMQINLLMFDCRSQCLYHISLYLYLVNSRIFVTCKTPK